VALDLVSVPQAMIARPLVAGAVAGWIVGDVDAGLRLGVLFELFALDVLPAGAVRYPDYGPATVVATALAADAPWPFALGLSAALGLVLAMLGGLSLQLVRRLNAPYTYGGPEIVAVLAQAGLDTRNAAQLSALLPRGAALTGMGLAAAWLIDAKVRPDGSTGLGLTLVAVGCALSAATGGALRSAGRGARLAGVAAGAVVGLVLAVLA